MKLGKFLESIVLEGIVAKIAAIISLFGFAALVSGFLIWNFYLGRLGFYEFNLIQARFLATGTLFLILLFLLIFIISTIWYICAFIYRKIKKANHADDKTEQQFQQRPKAILVLSSLYFIFPPILLMLIIYSYIFFPLIPQSIGGGNATALSFFGSKEQIDYLSNFGISTLSNVQTQKLCVIYENQDIIGFFPPIQFPGDTSRIFFMSKDNIKGFISLPSKTKSDEDKVCASQARAWLFNQANQADSNNLPNKN